jgi:S1-C subfamily serine protease
LALGAALSASFAPASSAPEAPPPAELHASPSPYFIDTALVERISCDEGTGSGSWIAGDRVLTAAHVVAAGNCLVQGKPTRPIYLDEDRDIAILQTQAQTETVMEMSCDAPVHGGHYIAIGYAFGVEKPVEQRLRGTTFSMDGFSVLKGNIFGGMSGGPVVNDDGEIVAIVNMYRTNGTSLSFMRSLSSTSLCGAA